MENGLGYDISFIDFNNYVIPDLVTYHTKKMKMYGENNSGFRYIKERYIGSITNGSVINSYVKYIIGEGLNDKSGFNINKYISKKDIRLIVQDFKLYGQFSLQVIWSQGSKLLKEAPKPILFKYINTEKLAVETDKYGEVSGYYYCFDWDKQSTYKPKLYKKFDGVYKDEAIEIITFDRTSSEPYYPHPDYLAGLQWAHIEEELSNSCYNHIMNGFSMGTIIKCKGGIPPTEELREIYKNKILRSLTGSDNRNKTTVLFTDGDTGDIDIEKIQVDQIDTQLVWFEEAAKRAILMSHEVVNPILFGVKDSNGFSNNADEMVQALKTLYRSNINPMREIIIDALEYLFKLSEPNIQLEFKDFEELNIVDTQKNNQQ